MRLRNVVVENPSPYNSKKRLKSPLDKAILGGAIGAPVAASLGIFDVTNPGELFRPKGYAQSYAEKGSQDRRKTAEPGMEIFERFFLGRRGRPLKYETAKTRYS